MMNQPAGMKSTTERLLSESFGGAVQLGEGHDLGGSPRTHVCRFPVLNGAGDLPASVIVKQANSTSQAPYKPDLADIPAWTLFNEWASLQFLSQVAAEAHLAPRFYAGDRATGLFIMEDLGEGRRLDHFLLGNDPVAAEAALVEFAAIHGRLHALTRDKLKDRMIVTSTVRQRLLLRSAVLAQVTEEFGHLEATGATVRAIAEKLQTRWPPAEYDMPLYPAFQ